VKRQSNLAVTAMSDGDEGATWQTCCLQMHGMCYLKAVILITSNQMKLPAECNTLSQWCGGYVLHAKPDSPLHSICSASSTRSALPALPTMRIPAGHSRLLRAQPWL
jgi:hypothetical protein